MKAQPWTVKVAGRFASRAAIEAVGARLCFLPTYSPDFNPIEMIFAKLKGLRRRAEARNRDHLIDATRDALTAITTRDARTCYRAAGVPLTTQLL